MEHSDRDSRPPQDFTAHLAHDFPACHHQNQAAQKKAGIRSLLVPQRAAICNPRANSRRVGGSWRTRHTVRTGLTPVQVGVQPFAPISGPIAWELAEASPPPEPRGRGAAFGETAHLATTAFAIPTPRGGRLPCRRLHRPAPRSCASAMPPNAVARSRGQTRGSRRGRCATLRRAGAANARPLDSVRFNPCQMSS